MSESSVYIAGSSLELPLIRTFITVVRDYGYTITYDWTRSFGKPDTEYTDAFLMICAQTDLDAVREADIVWYVTPHESSGKSEGSSVELGAALALGKIVLVSGALNRTRIFPRLATHQFAQHVEALEWLRMQAGK